MGIVLSVIGKIFFVLFVLIGCLLLLVLILLLAPVHYQVVIEKETELSVRGRIRWLGWILFVPFWYADGKPDYIIRIFGIPIRLKKRKKESGKEVQRAEKETGGTAGQEKEVSQEKLQESLTEAKELEPSPQDSKRELVSTEIYDKDAEGEKQEAEDAVKEEKKKKPALRERIQKIKTLLKKGKSVADKVREKKTWAGDAKEFWEEENTKQMVCILKDNVVHLLKKLKPKVFKGYVEFGTGDPCSTGQALGGLSIVYAWYGRGVRIIPDFYEKKLILHLKIKGRLSLITVVICVLRIIFSKGWNRFMNEAKELKEAL